MGSTDCKWYECARMSCILIWAMVIPIQKILKLCKLFMILNIIIYPFFYLLHKKNYYLQHMNSHFSLKDSVLLWSLNALHKWEYSPFTILFYQLFSLFHLKIRFLEGIEITFILVFMKIMSLHNKKYPSSWQGLSIWKSSCICQRQIPKSTLVSTLGMKTLKKFPQNEIIISTPEGR